MTIASEALRRNSSLLALLNGKQTDHASLRQDLHRHPETAFEERRTAAIVAERLVRCGIEVVDNVAETGVVGSLRRGSSTRAIALRADMDALPMNEENDFRHRSIHSGKMHACGHDGHVAILLAAAEHLAENGDFDGTVHFIFQPAEEGAGGAARMMTEGLFERFPVDAIYGLHNNPDLEIGTFALKHGAAMAGADAFTITIEGRGAHAAMPEQSIDPVIAAAAVIQSLQSIVSRELRPLDSAVLSITKIYADSSFNTIPDRVELGGTVRYLDTKVQHVVQHRLGAVASGIAQAHGCTATLRYQRLFPATVNAAAQTELCRRILVGLFGATNVIVDPQALMASEDFSFMLEAVPGCYVWAGSGDADHRARLHSTNYDFNDALLPLGAAYWVRLVEEALPRAH